MRTCEDCQLAWQGDSTRCPQCGKEEIPMFDNSGPALPCQLRDYFAAKAMQGILSNVEQFTTPGPEYVAEESYKIADAMLEARKK